MLHDASIVRRPIEPTPTTPVNEPDYLWRGRFIGIRCQNGWEYVERTKGSGVVAVIAVTRESELVLTEQLRPPLGAYVIDLPAGLTGDESGAERESAEEAGGRELEEETGYTARSLAYLFSRPTSAGLTNETVKFVHAERVTQTSKGGGVGSERITAHSIPLSSIDKWLFDQERLGKVIDPKVDVALRYLSSIDGLSKGAAEHGLREAGGML